ncbi:MAG: single-stranded DNA-binding protein, partial [Proteobacteria bacterium]|nr:single-stranded DNA-binding protein [Pseudomonadota bacterium]
TEVVANEVRFLGGRDRGEEGYTKPAETGYAKSGDPVDQSNSGGDSAITSSGPDDDIPF